MGCQSSREESSAMVGGGPEAGRQAREEEELWGCARNGRILKGLEEDQEFLSQDFSCCSPRQSKEPDRGPRAPPSFSLEWYS